MLRNIEERPNNALKVVAKEGESIESLLRRFKKKLKFEDRFREIRKWDYYLKPSDRKKLRRRRKKLTDGTSI
ncbi:MAG: 30S ribosomal protein S21 [Flammeovirgaceae bacterium]|nr:30S ribosomal protein S21 [Flammeovirgaceae bacterium]|tara:strand:- start:329 stop:544 length:216 start_codon:yes stop_codon:yes gene_type:complete